jgi:glycerol uptake facilitator-like aquaporin
VKAKAILAEAIGTALLLAAVVGSGITGPAAGRRQRRDRLLANTIATGGALAAIILAFGPISGAHFNPAVTIVDASQHGIGWRDVPAYIGAQIVGALGGVASANLMFGLPIFFASHRAPDWQWAVAGRVHRDVRPTGRHLGLFPIEVDVHTVPRRRRAYWFTSSTSFANPAATIARSLSDTFAGIRPIDAPFFIVAQLLGAVCRHRTLRVSHAFLEDDRTRGRRTAGGSACSQRHPFSRPSVMRPSTT